MSVNKVDYGGKTLIDLTEDTVKPETLPIGVTAHDAKGELITGIMPCKVTNLKNTSWIVNNWSATAGYGTFEIEGDYALGYGSDFAAFDKLYIGKTGNTPAADYVRFHKAEGYSNIPSSQRIQLKITDGADVTNIDLIGWLCTYGELQTSDRYDEGYNEGYGVGYDVGYDVGCMDTREIAYTEDKVPLIIQGLNSTNDYDLYNPQIFNTSLCGKSYNETDFFGYDVVTSSSAFDIAITNSSELCLYIEVHAWCQYTNADNNLEDEDFLLTLDIEPVTDGSASCTTTTPGSNHYWQYEIRGVWFS